jgi:glycosyltransferase involved in cell wall biosynthesis
LARAKLYIRDGSYESAWGELMKRRRLLMISGNSPPIICGIADYTANLLQISKQLYPEWEWIWLSRRSRWFNAPISTYRDLQLIRPTHSWNSDGIKLATTAVAWLKPHLIHIQDEIHSYFETDAMVQITKSAQCPVVVTLHEFHQELPSTEHTIKLAKMADAIITCDQGTSDRCVNIANRQPDLQAWSPANVLPLESAQLVQPIPELLTTFGLISPIKQLPIIFNALQHLRQKGLNINWRIIGPFNPKNNAYHAELRESFNVPWVEFTGGFCDTQNIQLRTSIAESIAMLLPFADGASPRRTSLQTAWAFGLPVITTSPVSEESKIQDGVNCLLVRESTPQAWSVAIESLFQDTKIREKLHYGSLATAKYFNWEKLANLTFEIYNSVLKD